MESRAKILSALKKKFTDTPAALPELKTYTPPAVHVVEKFEAVLRGIGGATVRVSSTQEINEYILREFKDAKRIVSLTDGIEGTAITSGIDPHTFADVDLIILQPHFAVAENAAAWITAERMGDRALPFIAQHIAFVITTDTLVHTMHDAYQKISNSEYPFGTFIAGPSKT
ncbi:MAG TPA: lactate utilization protein B/C, partial [Ohtaekwangia sp.]|uniref:LutC/YkgG family protein n=1 Tax=Ohtaekwangia sp. TaxID=2066019 RepID=UPI002F955B6A